MFSATTMFTRSKKRKQDASTDSSQMQLVRKRLDELQARLKSGVRGTASDTKSIMEYIDAAHDILDGNVKTLKISFSAVQRSDLQSMGVVPKSMGFNADAIQTRVATSDIDFKHIDALCLQLNRIYCSTSRRLEAGARMILDAVLLTLADVSGDARGGLPVAIFPEMQIGPSDGVLVRNAETGYSVLLTGYADYGVCTYRDVDVRETVLRSRLHDLMKHGGNHIILVEAKRDKETLTDYIPEALSQAVALSEVTGHRTVRCCLSDGWVWLFLVYTRDEEGNRVSYEGAGLSIMESWTVHEEFMKDVRRLVEVLYHWLRADCDIEDDPLCKIH